MPAYPFSEIRDRLDDWRVFNNMVDSPYYQDAVYEQFSQAEYERRYEAMRGKMRSRSLDCAVVSLNDPKVLNVKVEELLEDRFVRGFDESGAIDRLYSTYGIK